jgi:hypothetical protein
MSALSEAMTRLRNEIVSSRHARVALRGDLLRQTDERRRRVSALCAGFARDRAGAHRAWFGSALSERQTAERPPQRGLAEEARAKARVEGQPPAAPPAKPQRHASAEPVPAPVARSPKARRPPFKGSKKR